MSKLIEELKYLAQERETTLYNIEQLEVMTIKPIDYHGRSDESMGFHKSIRGGTFHSYKKGNKAGNNYQVRIHIFEDEWADFKEYLLASNYHRLYNINKRINQIESIDIKPKTQNPKGKFINWFKKRIAK